MSSMPPPLPPTPPQGPPPIYVQQQPAPLPPKKSGVPVVAIVAAVVIFALGVYGMISVRDKLRSGGFDPLLMQTNPALAMTKLAVALNPNLELVRFDERAGTIAMRDKTNQRVIVYRYDPVKEQLVIATEDGRSVVTLGGNDAVTVEAKAPNGTITIGSGAEQLPSWVPRYPDVTLVNTMSGSGPDGRHWQVGFDTKDGVDKVIGFFADRLKTDRYKLDTVPLGVMSTMMAENRSQKRTVQVTATRSEESTHVMVVAIEQN